MDSATQRFVLTALLWLLAANGVGWAQDLSVVSVSPTDPAAVGTSISVTFDRAVDPVTVTADSFWAFGRWSGPRAGGYAFSNGDTTVTMTPAQPFSAGEQVTVMLSNAIEDSVGVGLREAGYSWQFWTMTQPASLSFSLVADMTTGTPSRPYGGTAAMLDGDAFLDLAIVNETSDDVRVFLNQADGSGSYDPFGTPEGVGATPSPSETADFNRDGLIDLCVANVDGDSVSVLLGNGDGSFGTHVAYSLGAGLSPTGLSVLDVDGDGDQDIAAAGGFVHILLNDYCDETSCGNPAVFGTPILHNVPGTGERAIAAADMDNDGILDLVVGQSVAEQVVVLRGDGDPLNFLLNTSVQSAGGRPWMLATGDLDGDGDVDVSVANRGDDRDGGAILKNNGDGTLAAPVLYCDYDALACDVLVGNPDAVSTDHGDLDGDGDLDWTLSRVFSDLGVYLNDGSGNFTLDQTIAPPQGAACSILLDMDNDGRLDIAVIDELDNLMKLMKNSGPATPWTLTVTNAGSGAGIVTSAPAGIDCGSDCDEAYADETVVVLTPVADPGSAFAGWSGDPDCSDGSVTMNADKVCNATFTLETTVVFTSIGAHDGIVLESSEDSGVGGIAVSDSANEGALRVGDEGFNFGSPPTVEDGQFKSIVSFDTSPIPEGATITSATLRLRRGKLFQENPFDSLGECLVDVHDGGFEGDPALALGDFEAAATATAVATLSNPLADGDWSEGTLDAVGLATVSTTGITQFRAYFALDDDDDNVRDAMGFSPGEHADPASHPQLVLAYFGGNETPTVALTQPDDGADFPLGSSILFSGSADDAEDGDLTASLVWTSDLDGVIGNGGTFSSDLLSEGQHLITAEVTDGGGATGSASVTITLTPWILSVVTAGTGDGNVTSNPAAIDCGSGGTVCSVGFADGEGIALIATEDLDSMFIGWTGNGDCTDGSVTMDVDKTCVATFDLEIDLFLESVSFAGPEQVDACNSITTGIAVSIETSGVVTFRAGSRVALGSGFSVLTNATFSVQLDADVCP